MPLLRQEQSNSEEFAEDQWQYDKVKLALHQQEQRRHDREIQEANRMQDAEAEKLQKWKNNQVEWAKKVQAKKIARQKEIKDRHQMIQRHIASELAKMRKAAE